MMLKTLPAWFHYFVTLNIRPRISDSGSTLSGLRSPHFSSCFSFFVMAGKTYINSMRCGINQTLFSVPLSKKSLRICGKHPVPSLHGK